MKFKTKTCRYCNKEVELPREPKSWEEYAAFDSRCEYHRQNPPVTRFPSDYETNMYDTELKGGE